MHNHVERGLYPIVCAVTVFFSLGLFSCKEDIVPKQVLPPGPAPAPDTENQCQPNFSYGYCDKISYEQKDEITVFLHGRRAETVCRLNVHDMNGVIAFSVSSPLPVQQTKTPEPSRNGFGFLPTVKIPIPAETKSGVYFIERKIPFIIKSDREPEILVVYPSNTANAYAQSGGKSLYTAPASSRPSEVSFHRPIDLQSFSIGCLQWFMTQATFNIGYMADVDMEDYQNIKRSKIIVIIGHSEYWTRKARENFDRFVDAGGHALILSGNTMWWQVRYTKDYNALICYKDGMKDPVTDLLLKTVEWSTPSLEYDVISSIGADFPHGGYGMKSDQGWNGFKLVNPSSPLLEGLNLSKGSVISCPSTECDGAPISSFDAEGFPVLDKAAMHVKKAELIGFDKAFRVKQTYPTFIVTQRTKKSGIIINTGTTDWCSSRGIGGISGDAIKKITLNAITKLLNDENVFSE
jgi:hypothetical protein